MRILRCSLILSLVAAPAFACVTLDHADPKVGAALDRPPSQVTLYFSGHIFPGQSSVKVIDAEGNEQTVGTPVGAATAGEVDRVSVPLAPLKPGRYRVSWNVLCDCGSMNPGDYPFTVK